MDNQQYIVSARKYRPATFRSVVGQKSLTTTLKNAILSKRLAQAYLFCGPRGVGKTSCARIFAKTINCLNPDADGEACGVCENCRAIDRGSSFNIIELDAASNNGVDQIRNLTEQVNVPPQQGNYRVFIIDEVHMLSQAAFNAFLKTLEEPPSYVIFILATTEKHKVIPTILSRCQIYDFKRITVNDMAEHLAYVAQQEGITAEPAALNVIARKADGAMRDALSIFDQVAASTAGNLNYEATIANLNVLDYDYYFRLIDAFRAGDVGKSLLIYKEIRDKGFDSLFFINGLAEHIRDLMVAADQRTLQLLEAADDVAAQYSSQAQSLPVEWYYTALRLLNDCDRDYRMSSSKRLLVELTLVRLCQLLKPATPPFDLVDYMPPMRNPVEEPRRISSTTPEQTVVKQPIEQQQPTPSQPSLQKTAPQQVSTPQPPVARRVLKRPQTFRLSDVKNAQQQAPTNFEPRSSTYTSEQFMQAWKEYAANNPEQIQLCNGINSIVPQPAEDNKWIVTAPQPSIFGAFENNLHQLTNFIRDRLENDYVTLNIQLAPQEESKHKLTPKEMLEKLNRENRQFGQFLLDIDCEISQ